MDSMHLDCACHSWHSAMKSLGRIKKNWAALCHGQHAFNLSACHSWQSAMKSLERKKKNWAALCHGQHAFNLSTCCSWWSAMKSLGRKIKNWAALCHGRHAFRLRMQSMAECHEEFGRKRMRDMTCINASVLLYKCQCVVA